MSPLTIALLLTPLVALCGGHGYLQDPPNRSSAWRFGFRTPVNYNDMSVWCGGRAGMAAAGQKCGVCGDAYNGPRDHEMPDGKWVRPLAVTRTYRAGQVVTMSAKLTATHRGHMQFKICPVTDANKEVTQSCLDRRVMQVVGHGDRYDLGAAGPQTFSLKVRLPDGLKCRRCVVQWTYTAGNDWGEAVNFESRH